MDKKLLKNDINFLEFPTWVIAKRNKKNEYIIKKENGFYKLKTASDSLPDRTDNVLLYYLIMLLSKDNFKKSVINITRYKLAKNVLGSFKYDRIMKSLERWHGIQIIFDGIFYENEKHSTRMFHIIENVVLKEKELQIKFNSQFIDQLKNSTFYKYINFEEYKRLKRPVSNRLYEILIKTFKARSKWHIDIIKLAEKLTFSSKYPSKILEKLKPAINEINDNTELQIKFEYKKETKLCIFRAVSKIEQIKTNLGKTLQTNKNNNKELKIILGMLPENISSLKSVKELLEEFINIKGFDYVKSNIIYSLNNSKDNLKVYLQKALKENWGEDVLQQKVKENQNQKIQNKHLLLKKLKDDFDEINHQKKANYVNKLPKIKREKLIKEFENSSQMNFFKPRYLEVGFKDPMIKNLFISFVNSKNKDDFDYDENFKAYCKDNDLIIEKKGNDFFIAENEQLKLEI